ncbi:MAG: galactose mutarotase [Flavobacteriales bacterium]|nr:galactose mutarotase [Flavobacteriales bacterium]
MDADRFKKEVDGKQVDLYTLESGSGISCSITNYGARIVQLLTPDRTGHLEDIALGYDSLQEYIDRDEQYFGAVVGRYCNRIAHGRFELNGQDYQLPTNLGSHHLHGGAKGLSRVVWTVDEHKSDRITLSYLSPDGEEGYPGDLSVTVTYELHADGSLVIRYQAQSTKDTPLSLTNHCYFNLKGAGKGQIDGHRFNIHAEQFTEVDELNIPTGNIVPVEGTRYDLREGVMLQPPDLEGAGFDINYIVSSKESVIAEVFEPVSGRRMELFSDEPGVQFYIGKGLRDNEAGNEGRVYGPYSGFCLETQKYPDSPNRPHFPSSILKAGENFTSQTIYRFSVGEAI